jgi:hypothetical protein
VSSYINVDTCEITERHDLRAEEGSEDAQSRTDLTRCPGRGAENIALTGLDLPTEEIMSLYRCVQGLGYTEKLRNMNTWPQYVSYHTLLLHSH